MEKLWEDVRETLDSGAVSINQFAISYEEDDDID